MSTVEPAIGGTPVTIRLAMKMEDALQAIAVRAACFIGELEIPFSEEFDGHDYSATHVIAYLRDEPIGAVRVRWFRSFAMIDRLAVLPRYRRHGVGKMLLARCGTLAESRGCTTLYAQILPPDLSYWTRLGWRRLVPEQQSMASPKQIVAVVKAAGHGKLLSDAEAPESVILRQETHSERAAVPLIGCTH